MTEIKTAVFKEKSMRVLLATDGSRDAITATEWLRTFPLPGDTRVLVLTVVTAVLSPVEASAMEHLRMTFLDEARRVAEDARKLLEPRWPDAAVRVTEGDPREEIVRAAEEWPADLVVVGARGLGAVKGFVLGSVSVAVARYAPCPVLVVKGPRKGLRRAIVAVDGSEDSLKALRLFASVALGGKPRVCVLGVVPRLRIPPLAPRLARAHLRAVAAQAQQERRAEVEAVLGRAAVGLREQGGDVETAIPVGRPGEEIVRAANELGADLIVVGARGMGGVKRLLLGSVSEEVLRAARCPVLIVKGSGRDQGGY